MKKIQILTAKMSGETQPPGGSTEDMSADSGTEDKLSSSVSLVRENIPKAALTRDSCKTTQDTSSSTTSASTDTKDDKKTIFSNLPKFDTQDWYSHKCFNRYWSHYGYVMNWYKKHGHVQRSLQRKLSYHRSYPSYHTAYPYQPYSYQPYSYPFSHAQYMHRQTPVRSRRGRGRATSDRSRVLSQRSVPVKRKQGDMNMDVDSDFADAVEAGDDVACDVSQTSEREENVACRMELEITDEMLDFFATSQKHRKQREAEKKEEIAREKKDKRINIEDVRGQQRERTSEAPSERPGLRRTSEMKLLYGKGAAMIHGMETALQMTYDRHLDANQPKYWPNMPLRVHFSDA
ncbi:gem-associated protein 8-like [Haliotis rufescens]|uniref:gem-associated protein 8-like n=1 Tax=Haliotis rufescens TaxID=6454 RepID=UPI00201F988F|nr:gem-associated protein 8-like [Haliotis rufescens]